MCTTGRSERGRQESPVILVLGRSGLLGSAMAALLERLGRPHRAVSPAELDIGRPETIATGMKALAPDAVVNAAAFTDVNKAELPEHRSEVFLVNRDGPEALARVCAAGGIPLVHVSTDYVFDGSKGEPYGEDDPTGPLQVYGESKLEGERRVFGSFPDALVVRTSTLYGSGRPSRPHYVDAIALQARQRQRLDVVESPVSAPTYAPDLAEGILALLDVGATGVVHAVNEGACSRLELARAIVESMGLADAVEVRTRAEPEGALRRPAFSALSTARLASLTGRPPRPWRTALDDYLSRRRR
jgi:dTDP-4-dehydrorhamnose reductase